MATYTYHCDKCDKDFEISCSMKDHSKIKPCTECGTDSTQVIQAVGFDSHFQGSAKCPDALRGNMGHYSSKGL